MRACIFGAGAMGTVLGAFIARAGRQADLVTRNREHVAALMRSGAVVRFSETGGGFTQKVNAMLPEDMSGKYDVIFLMTKQRGNKEVVRSLMPFLAEGGAICTMQNGLPEQSVAEVAGGENTIGCAVSWGASRLGAGEVALTSSPEAMTFSLGTLFNNDQKLALAEPFLACAGKVVKEDNFLGARWSKLIVNSAFSTLSAITSLTFGQIAGGARTRAAAQVMLKEAMDTGLACGVVPAPIQGHDLVALLNYRGAFKRAFSYLIIPLAMKNHRNLVSGMYYDLAAGRKCDMQFIAGAVAAHAQGAHINVPYTRAALAVAEEIERGERGISPDNIRRLTTLAKQFKGE